MEITRRMFAGVGGAALLAGPSIIMMEGCSTSWITTAENDLPAIVQIATSIISIVALASGNGTLAANAAAEANTYATTVKNDLTLLQTLISDYKSSPSSTVLQKIDAALSDITQNLQSILTAVHVNNTSLQSTIATAVSLALSAVAAVQLLIPVTTALADRYTLQTSAERVSRQSELVTKTVLPSAANLKTMFNAVAVQNGYGSYQVK